ncbi:hypothetical protein N7462_006335 [Penicillium macrosclerotiorum]|uniref:uncharacterized protein n=1 Tax=Penicillium macrosclerotiorum TaxID=303699 RepID=UPI002546F8DB|nr:uncharacterized protein N7462_006335 [Penicillium macrosclerotiorum]KAJ5683170.1 hypothetical protein N7462_006335 [Penicillium macrosclerotiorum]
MHLLALLGAISLLVASVVADSLPFSSDLYYWPVGATKPSVLARVAYDPASLKSDVISYHPPQTDRSDGLARIGLYTSTTTNPKQWIGSLISQSSLTGAELRPTFRLHLGPSNEIYHVSMAESSAIATAQKAGPLIELVTSVPGTQPHLNRPVVVGPDGQNPEQVEEKSLFQKYWWVLLILMFLTMSGGGEGQ